MVPKASRHALPHLVLNVPALAARSENDVVAYLGSPDPGTASTDPTRKKLSYWGGRVEVVFVEGKVGWIKLYASGDLPFSPDALSKLGLSAKRPTYVNAGHVISWHNLPHLREVSLYGGGPRGTVSSVLVCVETGAERASAHQRRRISFPRLRAVGGA